MGRLIRQTGFQGLDSTELRTAVRAVVAREAESYGAGCGAFLIYANLPAGDTRPAARQARQEHLRRALVWLVRTGAVVKVGTGDRAEYRPGVPCPQS